MTPFCSWESRGLLVNLSDDKLSVRTVEAQFTMGELRAAHLRKNGSIPAWLKEKPGEASMPKKSEPIKVKPTKSAT